MKGSNPGAIQENPKQKEGIESERDAREPGKKRRKGSNLGTMLENPNKNQRIKSRRDT